MLYLIILLGTTFYMFVSKSNKVKRKDEVINNQAEEIKKYQEQVMQHIAMQDDLKYELARKEKVIRKQKNYERRNNKVNLRKYVQAYD